MARGFSASEGRTISGSLSFGYMAARAKKEGWTDLNSADLKRLQGVASKRLKEIKDNPAYANMTNADLMARAADYARQKDKADKREQSKNDLERVKKEWSKQASRPGFGAAESVDFVRELMSLGLTRDEAMREVREMLPKAKISAPKQDVVELKEKVKDLSLSEIANIIRKDWSGTKKGVYFGAQPYLDAMGSMANITDNYNQDSGKEIVTYLLGNAASWRGDVAKVVKAELKRRLKD